MTINFSTWDYMSQDRPHRGFLGIFDNLLDILMKMERYWGKIRLV